MANARAAARAPAAHAGLGPGDRDAAQPRAAPTRSTSSWPRASTASASRPCCARRTGRARCRRDDLEIMLGEMIDCGREFERRVAGGRALPLRQHGATRCGRSSRGTHRPYPCGAGAGYLGVSADGDLAACHRFVGDADGAMGSLDGRRRPDAPGRLARRAPRPPPGALPRLLGALSVRRRLPSRSHPPRPAGVRLHPRLAALLPRGVFAIGAVGARRGPAPARRGRLN